MEESEWDERDRIYIMKGKIRDGVRWNGGKGIVRNKPTFCAQ